MSRLLAVATLAAALLLAPAAHGWVQQGKRWPGATVSVWNTTGYSANLRDAMWAWNRAGAAIQLVAAPTGSRADVVVRYGVTSEQGSATVGFMGARSTVMLARGLGSAAASALAAHELGHVLGLGHETRACSMMTPVIEIGTASDCRIATCHVLRRCLVQTDDAVGLQALYGRRHGG